MCGLGKELLNRIACLLIIIATVFTVSQPIRQSIIGSSSSVISNTPLDFTIKTISSWGEQEQQIEKAREQDKQKKYEEKCKSNCNHLTVENKQEKTDNDTKFVNQTYIILSAAFVATIFALYKPMNVLMFFLFTHSTAFVAFLLLSTYHSLRGEQIIALILVPASIYFLDLYARICYLIFSYTSPLYNNNNFDHLDGDGKFFKLLPSQEEIVGQIKSYAGFTESGSTPPAPANIRKEASPATGAVLVSIEGAWGSGKTVCVDDFERWARRSGDAVVVNIKAGQLEAEEHIESALMRTIIRNWDVASQGGWLAVPALGIVFSQGKDILKFAIWLTRSLISSTPQSQEAHAHDTSAHKVLWYNTLRAIVCRITRKRLLTSKRKTFCLIVDDIDRCSPIVAQRIMTLLRRFFDIPGLTIITPFVREQLYYKAFNPDQELLTDLAATAEAYLEDRYRDDEAGYVDEVRNAIAVHWEHRIKPLVSERPQGQSLSTATDGSGSLTLRGLDQEAREIRQVIRHRKYRSMPPYLRDEIAQSLASKYVSDHIIIVRPPSVEDMHSVIVGMRDFKDWVARLMKALEGKVDDGQLKNFEKTVSAEEFIESSIGDDVRSNSKNYGVISNSNILYLRDAREKISRTLQSTIVDIKKDNVKGIDDAYFLLMMALKIARSGNVEISPPSN